MPDVNPSNSFRGSRGSDTTWRPALGVVRPAHYVVRPALGVVWLAAWVTVVSLTLALSAAAADPSPEGLQFFEKKVRPLLVERCHECHAADAAESGLRLDSWEALAKGGERGPAIVPGKPDESLLISAVRHGEVLKMPPKRKLSAAEVSDLERWVAMGAPWPGATGGEVPKAASSNPTEFSQAQRSHWAFQRPGAVKLPRTTNEHWATSPVDLFVLEKLEANALSPAPAASRATLIRRVTFGLTGLPPTPEEVDAFVADNSPDSWARLVDRLLNSPRYGERWGRHWLDVSRYADSNGLDENLAYANAFRFRDYAIDSFNADKPFDRFIREQLAGDLLPSERADETNFDNLVATGFLSFGAKMLAEDDPVKMQMDIIDEQVDTLGRAFLGLTLGCARCHDHKFDPISTADYYALAGIFKSTRTMETHSVVARWLERPLASPDEIRARDEQQAKVKTIEEQTSAAVAKATANLLDQARRHAADYLLAAYTAQRIEKWKLHAKPLGDDARALSRPDVTLIESENYVRGNVLKDVSTYGQGIGVLVNKGEVPNFAEYDVSVPSDGLYQFEIRHAAASSRPTRLIINGELAKPDAAAAVTGSWNPDGQRWTMEGFFRLRAGNNVVRLEQPQFFPHIDKLLIAPAPPAITGLPSESLSGDFRPIQEFVRQWQELLDKSRGDPESVFSVWHEFIVEGEFAVPTAIRNDPLKLLAGNSPGNVVELARRYEERFQRIIKLWEEVIAKDKSAMKLDLPADEAFRVLLFDDKGPFVAPKDIEACFAPETVSALKQLREQKTAAAAAVPKLPETMAVRDLGAEDLRIHIRGSHLTLGAVAPRGLPRVFFGQQPRSISAGQSGRMELAGWIAGAENPLTARVLVNRVWQWHFGEGLVRSPDNFGLLGEQPTHPALLDWLAEDFVASGWSIKELQRRILLSSTYQMSGRRDELAVEKDPDNRLLWRFSRHRLDAESVRDSILAVADQLDLGMRGTLLPTANRQYVTSTANVDPVVYDSRRRSVYLPVVRSALYDVFQTFDFADPSVAQGKRETTTIAPQALFMMNSKFVSAQCRSMAAALLADATLDEAARVDRIFLRSLGRQPTVAERDRALQYVRENLASTTVTEPDAAKRQLSVWQSLCRAVISSNEFVYVE